MEELTYRMEGDYQVPNLLPPEEDTPIVLGKYALARKKFLKQNRRILFTNLLTAGTLNQHLMEIEQTANERMELLTRQMAQTEGVTEELKASDQMKWVGLMNNIRQAAEETILNDLIYA
ncbi:TnpV protein [Caproiciproducens sp. CPB-2]|uniref:TnpV protein n=1 Tax=Caproiciproducens sp. CPB-2 TaxID=3030017 RepID=UPI0023DB0D92|nr:TnpV protein [Caproiciproducens sp. CPB-2]MDF1494569.1 TnpV protein [Caproiciproducens sp. CPB-2]